ncbi:MAG: hypothetical protein ACFCVH_08065 [Alphaproteobacteria bacterium]
MTTFVYVILVFFTSASGAPFDTGINTRTYDTLEQCLAAIPATIAAEVPAELQDRVEGAACVMPTMADAIMGVNDAPMPQ